MHTSNNCEKMKCGRRCQSCRSWLNNDQNPWTLANPISGFKHQSESRSVARHDRVGWSESLLSSRAISARFSCDGGHCQTITAPSRDTVTAMAATPPRQPEVKRNAEECKPKLSLRTKSQSPPRLNSYTITPSVLFRCRSAVWMHVWCGHMANVVAHPAPYPSG